MAANPVPLDARLWAVPLPPLVLVVDPLSLVNGARVQVVSRPHAAQATFTPFNNIYQKMLERRSYRLYRSKAKSAEHARELSKH